ncbi:MAG: hypothetical protein EBZ69_10555 [Alphaproteobacteria bacterium]|nr:hypothetical protein [Alphaproteobacteria bacterium]
MGQGVLVALGQQAQAAAIPYLVLLLLQAVVGQIQIQMVLQVVLGVVVAAIQILQAVLGHLVKVMLAEMAILVQTVMAVAEVAALEVLVLTQLYTYLETAAQASAQPLQVSVFFMLVEALVVLDLLTVRWRVD